MGIRITQVDAFTDQPFRGNPAAICILPLAAEERWMRDVAREMNLSETAFLYPQDDGYNLRWFTPSVEITLCGHATLASAHVLWEEGRIPESEEARFRTMSGLLTAQRKSDWIELDFPAVLEQPSDPPPGLAEALGATPRYAGKNKFDYLVELDSAETVRKLSPNFSSLRMLGVRGVIVTSRSDSEEYDFISRFFAPGSGIDEDPVTGSAHCCLCPFWSARTGKKEMVGYQASARGGIVRVRQNGDRVVLGGKAVTVLRGELI